MSRISLLSSCRNGIAKLADESIFRIAPEHIGKTVDWIPGTSMIVQDAAQDAEWKYRLISSCRGVPVKANLLDEESVLAETPPALRAGPDGVQAPVAA